MEDIIIGLLLSFLIILALEIFKKFDKKIIAALILVGIAFIYVGFTWQDATSLVAVVLGIIVFLSLSYFGLTKNSNLIIIGLFLHGIWDIFFPKFSESIPEGYDWFCLTVDFSLAIYFYFRFRKVKD